MLQGYLEIKNVTLIHAGSKYILGWNGMRSQDQLIAFVAITSQRQSLNGPDGTTLIN